MGADKNKIFKISTFALLSFALIAVLFSSIRYIKIGRPDLEKNCGTDGEVIGFRKWYAKGNDDRSRGLSSDINWFNSNFKDEYLTAEAKIFLDKNQSATVPLVEADIKAGIVEIRKYKNAKAVVFDDICRVKEHVASSFNRRDYNNFFDASDGSCYGSLYLNLIGKTSGKFILESNTQERLNDNDTSYMEIDFGDCSNSGKRVGIWKRFYKDQLDDFPLKGIKFSGEFGPNGKVGVWRLFDKSGATIVTKIFTNGETIKGGVIDCDPNQTIQDCDERVKAYKEMLAY